MCLRPARKALFSEVSFEKYEIYTWWNTPNDFNSITHNVIAAAVVHIFIFITSRNYLLDEKYLPGNTRPGDRLHWAVSQSVKGFVKQIRLADSKSRSEINREKRHTLQIQLKPSVIWRVFPHDLSDIRLHWPEELIFFWLLIVRNMETCFRHAIENVKNCDFLSHHSDFFREFFIIARINSELWNFKIQRQKAKLRDL